MVLLDVNFVPLPMEKSEKTSRKKIVLILLVVALILCCVCSASMIFVAYLSGGESDGNSDSSSSAEDDTSSYLGFEEVSVTIADNQELNEEMFRFYENLHSLAMIEESLALIADEGDVDSFFGAYTQYNTVASEIVSEAAAMSGYLEGETDSDIGLRMRIINPVEAKERSSIWYYIPIIRSLVKAKHESIETARAGVYDYLKNELEPVDRDAFLDEYGLGSVEDLRSADDVTVEKLARDPELRAGIDWTKVATDLGKQQVLATVDAYKIGSSMNPVGAVASSGVIGLATGKASAVKDQMPPGEERVTLAVADTVKMTVDIGLGEDAGKDWDEIDGEKRGSVIDAVTDLADDDVLFLGQGDDADMISEMILPSDLWDVLTVTTSTAPVLVSDVIVVEDETTSVEVPYADLSEYAVGADIAATLGFQTVVDGVEQGYEYGSSDGTGTGDVTACSDIIEVTSWNEWDVESCEDSYASCLENPYKYEEGYSTCISAGGGCWDIGRWEYVNEGNCPIDSENNLDYEDERLQDDYEYFGGGNRAYCECIVDCREEFRVEKDCSAELETCCEAID